MDEVVEDTFMPLICVHDPTFSQSSICKFTGLKLLCFLKIKLSVFWHSLLFQIVKHDAAAVDGSIECLLTVRGDLDFAEQLWCKMSSSRCPSAL